MSEVCVHNWLELIEQLYADSWNPDLKRYRSPFVFRGLSDASCLLTTSLRRLGGNFAEMEPHLLRNFRKYAHRDLVERDTFWHWLSLAQHHGLPTRLMDWTISPLVAAHFATADIDEYDRDGAIWMVDQRKTHQLLPEHLQKELHETGADYFTVEMLSRVAPTLRHLDELAPPSFVLFFEPPSMDERIVNQYALFSVMPGAGSQLDEWLYAHPGLWRKIVLSASVKWEVRDKLDQANITERVLFPGLDGLSRWQKRYYTPAPFAGEPDHNLPAGDNQE